MDFRFCNTRNYVNFIQRNIFIYDNNQILEIYNTIIKYDGSILCKGDVYIVRFIDTIN
jgi:hypothetical protein